MKTLEQALTERIEQRQEMARESREAEAKVAREKQEREVEAAVAFSDWLSSVLESDLDGLVIEVYECYSGPYRFGARIGIGGGSLVCTSRFRISPFGEEIELEYQDRNNFWRASVDQDSHLDFSRDELLDALLYARDGHLDY